MKFIGRIDQRKVLRRIMTNFDMNDFVVIFGDTGIGKTTLIKEIRNEHLDHERLHISEIIDFKLDSFDIDLIFENKIAEHLVKEEFNNFYNAFADYQKNIEIDASLKTIETLSKSAKEEFIKDFNNSNRSKRYVLFFDAFDGEIKENLHIKKFFSEIIPKLKNCAVIVGGQQANLLKPVDESIRCEEIELKPFNNIEIKELFAKFNSNDIDKINLLAEGKPILLVILNEYLQKYVVLNFLGYELDYIKKNLKLIQQEFIDEIFSYFYKSDDEKYFHLIANLENNFSIKFLQYFYNIGKKEVKDILDRLEGKGFIKSHVKSYFKLNEDSKIDREEIVCLSLHERVEKELAEKSKIRIKDYGEQIKNYYEEIIKEYDLCLDSLKNIQSSSSTSDFGTEYYNKNRILEGKRIYTISKFKCWFSFNSSSAAKEIVIRIEECLNDNLRALGSSLIKIASENFEKIEKDETYYKLKYLCAKHYRTVGNYELSESYIKEIIKDDDDKIRKIEYLQTLSFVRKDTGKIDSALDDLATAMKICEIKEFENNENVQFLKALNYNNFGQLFTEIGNLEKAIENLESGLALTKKYKGKRFYKHIASLQFNIGIAKYFRYELNESEDAFKNAMRISQVLPEPDEFRYSLCKLYLSLIYLIEGDFSHTFQLLKECIIHFNQMKDDRYIGLTNLFLSKARYEAYLAKDYDEISCEMYDAETWLNQSLEIAEKAVELTDKYFPLHYAESLARLSAIQLELGKYLKKNNQIKKSKECFTNCYQNLNKSLENSKSNNLIRIQALAIKLFAELFFEKNESVNLNRQFKKLQKIGLPKVYQGYIGAVQYLIAKDLYRNNIKTEAYDLFIETIPLLYEFTEWPQNQFNIYIEEIGNSLITESLDIFNKYTDKFRKDLITNHKVPIKDYDLRILNNFIEAVEMKMNLK